MTTFKNIKNKVLAVGMVAAMAVGVSAMPVLAAEDTGSSTASITFEDGNLELVSAPDIDFGTGFVSTADQTYDTQEDNVITVGDNRGDPTGWQLTAQLGVFDNGLEDAYITVDDATATATDTQNTSAAPTAGGLTLLAGDSDASEVATAASGNGNGGWNITWAEGDTHLTVLGDTASAGQAQATIDWVLTDTVV